MPNPQFDTTAALGILGHFVVEGPPSAYTAIALPSYYDQNFKFSGPTQSYVMKISAAPPVQVESQVESMKWIEKHAASKGEVCPCPRLVPLSNSTGYLFGCTCPTTNVPCQVFLMEFIDNAIGLRAAAPYTDQLLEGFGRWLAVLNRSLQAFEHPGLHRDAQMFWNARNFAITKEHIPKFKSAEDQNILYAYHEKFDQFFVPIMHKLRVQPIHSDVNEDNALVRRVGSDFEMAAIIDFEDIMSTFLILELANSLCYAMQHCATNIDPFNTAVRVLAAYHKELPLTELEIKVLFFLIGARACTSVCSCINSDPSNSHTQVSFQSGWRLLRWMDSTPFGLAEAVFRHAVGFVPCPNTPSVNSWLSKNDAFPIISVTAGAAKGSFHIYRFDTTTPSREEEEALFSVGLYLEDRNIYTSENYENAILETNALSGIGTDKPERRTVHLGIDIGVPVGSELFAPYESSVFDFGNKALALDYGPWVVLRHAFEDENGQDVVFFTFYGHLSIESLAGLYKTKRVRRGEPFATIGSQEVNGGWPPHVHFQLFSIADPVLMDCGVCSRRRVPEWSSICPDPNLILKLPL